MKNSAVLFMSLAVAGCAADRGLLEPPRASFADDPAANTPVTCRKEKPTGSNRSVTVCRRMAGVVEQEKTERDMRALQRQSEVLR